MASKYSQAEDKIRNLGPDKVRLAFLKKELKQLELEYGGRGVNYDGIGGGTGVSDTTGDLAVRVAEQREDIELKITKLSLKIQHIEAVLVTLTEFQLQVILKFYTEGKQLWKIGDELSMSRSTAKRIKKSAMDRVIRGLYGED